LYNFFTSISRRARILAAVLAVLVILFGFMVFPSLINPEFEESQSKVPFYTADGEFRYISMVTIENPIYPLGINLSDEPVYFLAASPTLRGNFTFSIDATNFDLLVAFREKIVLSAKEGNTTYWEKEIPVTNNSGIWRGGPIVTDFTVDIASLKEEADSIQKVLKFDEGSSILEIVNTLVYRGKIEGTPVDETRIYSLPITLGSDSYKIDNEDLSQKQVLERNLSQLNLANPLNLWRILGIVAFVACLGLFIFVLAVKLGFRERDEATVRALMHYGLHTKYADFISRGELDEKTKEAIRIASLEDMVNTALDLNERVIFDEKSVIYFFIHNGILYFYKPGEEEPAGKKPAPGKEKPGGEKPPEKKSSGGKEKTGKSDDPFLEK
jgi:hypothetical protein